jgi:ATP-dependent DNA helicase RecQ
LATSASAGESKAAGGWWGSAGKRENSGASGSVLPGVDPELREYLREWRRVTSKKLQIAAFIIMHDSSLDHLCQVRPRSLAELRKVSGFGERKTEMYGPDILEALERFRNGKRIVPELSDD